MLKFTEVNGLGQLPKGQWVAIENDIDCGGSHFIIKSEVEKVSVLYFEEASEKIGGYYTTAMASVIHEGVLQYEVETAQYSLQNISLEDLFYKVLEEEESLVFSLINQPELITNHPFYSEVTKLAYRENVSAELKEAGLNIDGKVLHFQ